MAEDDWEELAVEAKDYAGLTIAEVRPALAALSALPDDYKIESGYYDVVGVYVNHAKHIVNFANTE